jgi:hypothetical protein
MIRRHLSAAAQSISDAVTVDVNDDDPRFTYGLTAPHLLKASPQHEGFVLKLHSSIVYSILPRFVQALVQKIAWLAAMLAPQWKRRHLILLGSYLYKFADNIHTTKGPKGSPIALQTISIDSVSLKALQDDVGVVSLPPGYTSIISVATLRKRQYYVLQSQEAALEWLNALQLARQEAITRSMGHAPPESFPKSWAYYNTLGANFAKKKERIRTKVETRNRQEMEMSSLNDAGPMSIGYFT